MQRYWSIKAKCLSNCNNEEGDWPSISNMRYGLPHHQSATDNSASRATLHAVVRLLHRPAAMCADADTALMQKVQVHNQHATKRHFRALVRIVDTQGASTDQNKSPGPKQGSTLPEWH